MRRPAPVQRVLAVVACSSCLAAHSSRASSAPPAGGSSASGGNGGWMRIPDQPDDGGSSYSADPSLMGFGRSQGSNGNCQSAPPNVEAADRSGPPPSYYPGSGPPGPPLASAQSPTRYGYYQQYDNQDQKQLYRPPRDMAQHSGWTERRDAGTPQQQYQQPTLQSQQHSYYVGSGATPPQSGNGEPLRLGTKLRSIVSRVKGAVRPGQNAVSSQLGYHTNASGSYTGGSYPPGSTWSSAASHEAEYPQQGTYGESDPYVSSEHGRPGVYHHHTEHGGYGQEGRQGAFYGGQQDGAPATYTDDHLLKAPTPREPMGGIDQEAGEWPQPPKHSQSNDGGFYMGKMTAGQEMYHDAHAVDNDRIARYDAVPGQHWGGVEMEASMGIQSPQNVPEAQHSQEGTYVEQSVLGEGWTTVNPTPTESVPAQAYPEGEPHPSAGHSATESGLGDVNYKVESNGNESLQRGGPPSPITSHSASDFAAPTESRTSGNEPGLPSSSAGHPGWISGRPAISGRSDMDERSRSVSRAEDPASIVMDNDGAVALSRGETRESPEVSTGGVNTYVPLDNDAHDAMQASADHGLEEVDWGDENEDLYEPAVVVGAFGNQDDKDEEALIRELERMDDIDGTRRGAVEPGGANLPEDGEGDADAAVEHTLDILFNSIKDEEYDVGEEGDTLSYDPSSAATTKTSEANVVGATASEQRQSPHVPVAWDGLLDDAFDKRAEPEGLVSDATTSEHEHDSTESLWGNTRRWETLPIIVSMAEGMAERVPGVDGDWTVGEDGEYDEREAPLDPIDLPPAAATDGIWNDEHLQDQLDAYWEQSRRASEHAGGLASRGHQQLGRYGQYLQPTYGPGDWVGKGAERGAMMQEPLPTPERGIVQNDLGIPNLFQGNQAPINIYGNIYVGNAEQRPRDGVQFPRQEANPRDRYLPQAETSWSGME